MEHGGRANSDGNSNRNDEENQKEQVEGGGPDSGVGTRNSDMDVEHEVLTRMDEQLREVADVADVERTPVTQEGRGLVGRRRRRQRRWKSRYLRR